MIKVLPVYYIYIYIVYRIFLKQENIHKYNSTIYSVGISILIILRLFIVEKKKLGKYFRQEREVISLHFYIKFVVKIFLLHASSIGMLIMNL